MKIDHSERLKKLPPYLFAEIDKKKKAAIERGADIISLGVGDPDLPTPKHIVDAMKIAVEKPKHHQYEEWRNGDASHFSHIFRFENLKK